MILQFKKITLHNFGSYADAEVNLCDRNFCLVSGENHYFKDNAISNGAGKSTIWSGICYALTGEAISGVTNNFKNINISEDSCYVKLELTVNTDSYVITRIYRPKSDLKLIKNDQDISGKGIRESEKVLAENLPDLTKDLIASTIIIGQGMPNKFSSFSPSGRKELLEKLTKSDFMIEDIKTRLTTRQSTVNATVRKYADSLLVNKTNLTNTAKLLQQYQDSLQELTNQDFNNDLNVVTANITQLTEQFNSISLTISKTEELIETTNKTLLQQTSYKVEDLTALNESYSSSTECNKNLKYKLESEISILQEEIIKLKSVKDICPTCGQKIPNVLKPDTTEKELNLQHKQQELIEIKEALAAADKKYTDYKNSIDVKYTDKINELQNTLVHAKQIISDNKSKLTIVNTNLEAEKTKLTQLKLNKDNHVKQIEVFKSQIATTQLTVHELESIIALTESAKNEADEHLAVLKKMATLIQRDFRGYLLEDIIKYIDLKAKEYCKIVFGTEDLHVYLDGNVLDITYCDKLFDSLSGGEKQRCDLILQFAIRDLLQQYLNYSSNILVLDEIFDGLDKLSTNKIIDLITNKLKDVESIFVISHHSDELELPIDSEIRVIKNENGISEVK